MAVVAKRETAEHPIGKRLVQSINRGLQRPEARAFANAFSRTMREVSLMTPSGLYLGTVGGFKPNWKRLERFAERIIRGLYWKEMGSALPPGHFLKATPIVQPTDELRALFKEVYASSAVRNFGAGAFAYQFTHLPKGGGTAWIIEFYGNVAFFAITADPNSPDLQDYLDVQSTSDLESSQN
jgi:hypothetical protein